MTRTRPLIRSLLATSLIIGLASVSRTEVHATTLDRMGGADRYETAAGITRRLITENDSISTVLLTTGENYPDAMSVGGWRGDAAILLTKRASIPASTLELLNQ
ncbi:MAG: hypothetical protein RLZZ39_736, partial [Actinomycetota bacterium]